MNLTQSDLTTIAQKTIDLDALQQYYHVKQRPERKPLTMALNDQLSNELSLTKFGEPVEWVSKDDVGERPVFEITKVETQDDKVVSSFRYPVEGVVGTVTLSQQDGKWGVVKHTLTEQ